MTDDLTELMHREVAGASLPAAAASTAIAHVRRRQRTARAAVAAAVIAAVAVAVPLVNAGRGSVNTVTPAAGGPGAGSEALPTPASASPSPDYLAGPILPGKHPGQLLGRAYRIGTATGPNGEQLTEIAYLASLPGSGVMMCSAEWLEGTPLSQATDSGCAGGNSGNGNGALLYGPQPAPFYLGDYGSPTVKSPLVMTFARTVGRANLLLAYDSDMPATASEDGGHPPVRKTLPVTLLGRDEADMPMLIGLGGPVPTGYTLIGQEAWDTSGKQVLHYVSGWYCGPDPKTGTTSVVCPS